jgi:hypothetical protein
MVFFLVNFEELFFKQRYFIVAAGIYEGAGGLLWCPVFM